MPVKAKDEKEIKVEPKTVKGITYTALVFDRSGSMGGIREEARTTINEQIQVLKESKKSGHKIKSSLILFNGYVEVLYENKNIKNVDEITVEEYTPHGSTAMNDAVAKSIELLDKNLKEDDAALVIVVSDGYENSSTISKTDLAEQIQSKQDTGQWTFSYLLANQDLSKIQKYFGIPAGNIRGFKADVKGMEVGRQATSVGTQMYFSARLNNELSVDNFYSKNKTEENKE